MEQLKPETREGIPQEEGIVSPTEILEQPKFPLTEEQEAIREQEIEGLENKIQSLKISAERKQSELNEVRLSLNLSPETNQPSETNEKIEKLEKELVEKRANYLGNWTVLLYERAQSEDFRRKFIGTREETIPHMKEGNAGTFDKPKTFQNHYRSQLDNYEENIGKVFSSTNYNPASESNKGPENLGVGNIGLNPTVFSDANLNTRQRNIIEAHEAGHGIRDFTSEDKLEISAVLDKDVINKEDEKSGKRTANYLTQAEEVVERMSQLKNYFGFKAGEEFTAKHLAYTKEKYIEDTGLDNGMGTFFKAITPEKEGEFLRVINKYPI